MAQVARPGADLTGEALVEAVREELQEASLKRHTGVAGGATPNLRRQVARAGRDTLGSAGCRRGSSPPASSRSSPVLAAASRQARRWNAAREERGGRGAGDAVLTCAGLARGRRPRSSARPR